MREGGIGERLVLGRNFVRQIGRRLCCWSSSGEDMCVGKAQDY